MYFAYFFNYETLETFESHDPADNKYGQGWCQVNATCFDLILQAKTQSTNDQAVRRVFNNYYRTHS